MIYPDEEKVTYDYNLGGQVDHVRGYKSYGYDYVNSEFSGGNTGTAHFSLYVSPYLVAGQGSKHTKHILHFRAGRKSFPDLSVACHPCLSKDYVVRQACMTFLLLSCPC